MSLVHHRVADFDAWKAVYDSFREVQKANGVRHHHVWRATDDPNAVVVVHTFDSGETARAFFDLADLKDAMGRAGVDASTLRIEFFEEAAGGAL